MFTGKDLGTYEDSFNFYQSSGRIVIERAFGILTQRWGILWKPMRFALKHVGEIVETCMCLHNICINERLQRATRSTSSGWADEGTQSMHLQQHYMEGTLIETCVTEENMTRGRRRDFEQCQRREMLTMALKSLGIIRPGHSMWGREAARIRAIAAGRAESARCA